MSSSHTDESERPVSVSPGGSRGNLVYEAVLFAVAALAALFVFVSTTGAVSFADRDLLDTDGYMRYLRVEDLLETGDWYDTVDERSNYPLGEESHWTRLLDVYVAVIALVLRPFLGADSLYWAAVVNGPLLLIALGLAVRRAFTRHVPPTIGWALMPAVLALPLVASYASPGRVDHHIAILVVFTLALDLVLRMVEHPAVQRPWRLGLCITAGVWLSTEFIVPMGLAAATVGLVATARSEPVLFRQGAAAFSWAALGLVMVVLVERGTDWAAVEFDRVSVVHPVLAAVAAVVLWSLGRLARRWSGGSRWWIMTGVVLAGATVLLALFPRLAGGPFVDVDPRVADVWLFGVGELQPVWSRLDSVLVVLGPAVVGAAAGLFLVRRHVEDRWVVTVLVWLVVYMGLTAAQVRWAIFAHTLSLPLLLAAVSGPYARLAAVRGSTVLRPVLLAVLIGTMTTAGAVFATESSEEAETVDCDLADVLGTLARFPPATVLAEQDVGPEILYRTDHRVIATPYHRNEAGILYVRDVMSLPAEAARAGLAERDVGLILVCPGRQDLTRPVEVDASFYDALVSGPPPGFVREIDLGEITDYRLFVVDP